MTTLQKMRAMEYTILVANLHYNTSLMQKKLWLNILCFINNNFKAKCDIFFFLRNLGATGLGRNRWNLIILQSFKICTKLMFWKHKFSPNLEILYFYTETVFWIHEFNAKIWNNFVFYNGIVFPKHNCKANVFTLKLCSKHNFSTRCDKLKIYFQLYIMTRQLLTNQYIFL